MNELLQPVCCNKLFSDFTFQDLRKAEPPYSKGVYAVRISKRGKSAPEVASQIKQLIDGLTWPTVGDFILSRITRLERIGQCSIIYIGSAGTRKDSHNTLRGRYEEFAGRHTAMYPLWALAYFGWNLDFGWIVTKDAASAEKGLKNRYKARHGGTLPALVER